MAKSKTIMVLEAIANGAADSAAVIFALASIPYGSSFSKMNRILNEATDGSPADFHYSNRDKTNLRKLVCKLKREGLINSIDGKFRLTAFGKNKLKKHVENALPDAMYEKVIDQEVKIIAFDIPEKSRRKRKWLRDVLNNLDFKMLQKSVWYGRGIIAESFITDLRNLGILEYVSILAVTKTGSAQKLELE